MANDSASPTSAQFAIGIGLVLVIVTAVVERFALWTLLALLVLVVTYTRLAYISGSPRHSKWFAIAGAALLVAGVATKQDSTAEQAAVTTSLPTSAATAESTIPRLTSPAPELTSPSPPEDTDAEQTVVRIGVTPWGTTDAAGLELGRQVFEELTGIAQGLTGLAVLWIDTPPSSTIEAAQLMAAQEVDVLAWGESTPNAASVSAQSRISAEHDGRTSLYLAGKPGELVVIVSDPQSFPALAAMIRAQVANALLAAIDRLLAINDTDGAMVVLDRVSSLVASLDAESAGITHYLYGRAFADQSDYTTALAHFDMAADFPCSCVYEQSAFVWMRLDNHTEAIADLTRAIELQPSRWGYWTRAGLLQGAGDIAAALLDYAAAIALEPGDPEGYIHRGWVYRSIGDAAAAALDFERALALDPESDEAHMGLADVAYSLGQVATAIRHYEAVISHSPLERAGYSGLASTLQREGDQEGVLDVLNDMLAAIPEPQGSDYLWRAEVRLGLGDQVGAKADALAAGRVASFDASLNARVAELLAQIGELEASALALSRAIVLARADASVPVMAAVAETAHRLGDSTGAIELLEQAIELDATDQAAYLVMARILDARGDIAGQLRTLSDGIEKATDPLALLLARALLYREAGDVSAAITDLTRIIETGDESRLTSALSMRARLFADSGDYGSAIMDQGRVADLTGTAADIAVLGYYHELDGDMALALTSYTAALSVDEYLWARHRRAVVFIFLERYHEAVIDLTVAIGIKEEPWVYEMRAVAYESLGMTDEASSDRAKAAALRGP